MQIGRIEGCTRVLGKAQGYLGLPLRDEVVKDTATGQDMHMMVTAWFPTPDELTALMAGAPVHMRIAGQVHPPCLLTVGDIPE